MNIAMDNQWSHEANNFAMDNNDYEKAFESAFDDGDGKFQRLLNLFKVLLGESCLDYLFRYVHDSTSVCLILMPPNGQL